VSTDEEMLSLLQADTELSSHITNSCIGAMASQNHFDSINYAIDFLEPKKMEMAMLNFDTSAELVIE